MPAALLLAALTMSAPQGQAVAPQPSLWELVVNGVSAGEIVAVLDGADVWVPVEALTRAGLLNPGGRRQTFLDAPHVLLQSLADVSFELDTTEVVMRLTAGWMR